MGLQWGMGFQRILQSFFFIRLLEAPSLSSLTCSCLSAFWSPYMTPYRSILYQSTSQFWQTLANLPAEETSLRSLQVGSEALELLMPFQLF